MIKEDTCNGIVLIYAIGTLKTNRIPYLCGIKQNVSEFALHLRKTDANVSRVTVDSRSYYVYRYEGCLNGVLYP